MKIYHGFTQLILSLVLISCISNAASAQNGDQILDGIGETGLSARYLFNGDARDWSRNNFHGSFQVADVKFINDNRFGKVLSLSGEKNSFISLPTGVLNDAESLSISGWVYLRSQLVGQHFFDFGKDSTRHFYLAPSGIEGQQGLKSSITSSGDNKTGTISPLLEINKWIYLTAVVDIPLKSLTIYVNGKAVARSNDAPVDLSEVFERQTPGKNFIFIGKSLQSTEPNLNAMVHDFRIYRVALTAREVAGIYDNAQGGINPSSVNTNTKKEDDLPQFSISQPQLYSKFLIRVSDVKVETALGDSPRLPGYVDGIYKNNIKGPKVPVIWPSPTDNKDALKPGTYTIVGRVAGTGFRPRATITVKSSRSTLTPPLKLQAFRLEQVALRLDEQGHNSKFIENRDKFISTLSKTNPDAFLYMFRHAFGRKQPIGAKPLGVWDSEDTKLRGHATGHYLSAIAQAYGSTTDKKDLHDNFSKKMEYMVNTIYELSQLSGKPVKFGGKYVSDPLAIPFGPSKSSFNSDLSTPGIRNDYWNWGKGFISAYPPDQFIMLENGAKYGGQKNQIWAPYYTLHKILAGLLDIYEVSGNKRALEVASDMGDWVYARLSRLPQEKLIKMWDTYIAGEYGGMNESMARLYQITGENKYLKTAQLFDNVRVFYGDTAHNHGLAKNVDLFRGLHANQHIPQIAGSIEMYRVSKNPEYYKIADNFWHKIVSNYMYSIGGVAGARNPANAECFIAEPSSLYENGFSDGGQNETCATYNMLKLTGDLFLYDQKAELMDYYERALYNHILSSVAENSPANTYHVPLRPGSIKQFSNSDMTGFTCCNGTAIESNTKLQNSIYFKDRDNQALYVNLYIPSVLNWTERNLKIIQHTNFPKEDRTRLTIEGNGRFDLNVRVPGWATKGFIVKINGVEQKHHASPGSYLKLNRDWKQGDEIELQMPFEFHLDPVMDQPNIASLFYGPILLAAQEPGARKDWRKIELNALDLGKTIKKNPQELEFSIDGTSFKPFYNSYGRHSVYFDVKLK